MLKIRNLASQILILVMLSGLQACGLDTIDGHSIPSGQEGADPTTPAVDDHQNGGSGSGNGNISPQIEDGKKTYDVNCAYCHGDALESTGVSAGGDGGVINVADTAYGSQNLTVPLVTYLKTDMSKMSACKGECAENVAAYIQSWASGRYGIGNGGTNGRRHPEPDVGNGGDGSCGAMTYGPRTIRVLTRKEFVNSIEDLTQIDIKQDLGQSVYDTIPKDNVFDGFSNNTMAVISTGALQSYDLVVNQVVDKLAENGFEPVLSCNGHAASCSAAFVERYIPKVFRRPLTDAEINSYTTMFSNQYTGGSLDEGLKIALRTMFTSPQFLYRDETGVSIQDIKSGHTGNASTSDKQVLIHPDSPVTLTDYNQSDHNGTVLSGDDLAIIIARNVSDSPSVNLAVNANGFQVITIDSTEYKTYKVPVSGQSTGASYVALQGQGAKVEISSFIIIPASAEAEESAAPEVEPDDDAYVLTPYQLASYLAYTFTGSTPDDALLAAAGNGELETDEQITAQVERLLKTDRARKHFGDFAAEWFRTDGVLTATKDESVFPNFTQDVREAMAKEVRELFNHVVLDEAEPFSSMYNGHYTFVNQALAEFYGISGVTGNQMQKVTVNDRAGLVTSGAFLSFHAHEKDTAPILRSTYARRRFMCHFVPAPPTGVSLTNGGEIDFDAERQAALDKLNAYLEAHNDVATSRLKYGTQTSASVCQTCHKEMINPLGFGFEDFNAVGLPQTKDYNGLDIDASGELIGVTAVGDGQSKPFYGAKELADIVAGMDETRQCFVENTFRMAMGTGSTYIDHLLDVQLSQEEKRRYSCQVKKLDSIMVSSGNSTIELLKALGTMDSVRYRKDVVR